MISRRLRFVIGVSLAVIIAAGALLTSARLAPPPPAYALVDVTTLVVLKGQVEIQPANQAVSTVTADTTVRIGDRVRTGPDSYAAITFFDGSSTALDPDTEIIVQRLERTANSGSISFQVTTQLFVV